MVRCKEEGLPPNDWSSFFNGRSAEGAKHKRELEDVREAVQACINMAEERINSGGNERPESQESAEAEEGKQVSMNKRKSAKYDAGFYGELASIPGFKKSGSDLTLMILRATGGKMNGMKKDASILWKPSSRIYTKEFVKRFPKLDDPEGVTAVGKNLKEGTI